MLKLLQRSATAISQQFCSVKVPIEAIKRLREQTSAPMGQCKTALEETNCDHSQALLWLKKKGLASAAKRSEKETREGVVGAMVTGCRSKVALVEVNCETDFVAKNELFLNFVNNLMVRAIEKEYLLDYQNGEEDQGGIEAFLDDCEVTQLFPQDESIKNLYEQYQVVSSRLQQNIRIRRVITLHSDKYKYGVYVHQSYQDFIGVQASVTEIQVDPALDEQNEEQLETFGDFADNMATQVLGSPPKYFSMQQIPPELIEEETNRVKQQMKSRLQKAPEHTHKKIIDGKLNASFYEEVLLQRMPYILSNDGIPVEQYWKEVESELNKKFKLNNAFFWQCK